MEDVFIIILSLLAVTVMLSVLSNKIGIAYPVFLVIAGLVISFFPGTPEISVHPDVIFFIFLPPLLFIAAANTSWRDFWFFKTPIMLLAFGLVIFTSVSVAFVSHALIPDFTLAAGFLLGGIISPTDAVAATSVTGTLKVPRQAIIVIEGESLINDASGLIVFRFALLTILTGSFALQDAAVNFLFVSVFGIITGIAIAMIVALFLKYILTDAATNTTVALIAPYLMYIVAEKLHCSGVLSVVSGGLFLSYRAGKILNYESRMQIVSVYKSIEFLLNSLLFILIGLELKFVVHGIHESTLRLSVWYGIIISLAAIVIRIIWIFACAHISLLNKTFWKHREIPSWRELFIIAWCGMRGGVSLAAALTIPEFIAPGKIFPHRNLILFITFAVILFTFVLQGLSLPFIIRLLRLKTDDTKDAEAQINMNRALNTAVLQRLNDNYKEELKMSKELQLLFSRYSILEARDENFKDPLVNLDEIKENSIKRKKVFLDLLQLQREMIARMRTNKDYTDQLLRTKEYELDLEEARIRGTKH